MSVGVFMGIRASFTDQTQESAGAYEEAINRVLRRAGLPEYYDPPSLPNVYVKRNFGRSAFDHHSATRLMGIAYLAGTYLEKAEHVRLIERNPFRVTFVPIDFAHPFKTNYKEKIGGSQTQIWVGSAQGLFRELCELAPVLGIPFQRNKLSDSVVERINALKPLDALDEAEPAEERTAWLLLYEGARLALKHGVALSLAG